MTNDEAERIARDGLNMRSNWQELNALYRYILSGSMKREIENAAYERAITTLEKWADDQGIWQGGSPTAFHIKNAAVAVVRSLITPAKTADTEG